MNIVELKAKRQKIIDNLGRVQEERSALDSNLRSAEQDSKRESQASKRYDQIYVNNVLALLGIIAHYEDKNLNAKSEEIIARRGSGWVDHLGGVFREKDKRHKEERAGIPFVYWNDFEQTGKKLTIRTSAQYLDLEDYMKIWSNVVDVRNGKIEIDLAALKEKGNEICCSVLRFSLTHSIYREMFPGPFDQNPVANSYYYNSDGQLVITITPQTAEPDPLMDRFKKALMNSDNVLTPPISAYIASAVDMKEGKVVASTEKIKEKVYLTADPLEDTLKEYAKPRPALPFPSASKGKDPKELDEHELRDLAYQKRWEIAKLGIGWLVKKLAQAPGKAFFDIMFPSATVDDATEQAQILEWHQQQHQKQADEAKAKKEQAEKAVNESEAEKKSYQSDLEQVDAHIEQEIRRLSEQGASDEEAKAANEILGGWDRAGDIRSERMERGGIREGSIGGNDGKEGLAGDADKPEKIHLPDITISVDRPKPD